MASREIEEIILLSFQRTKYDYLTGLVFFSLIYIFTSLHLSYSTSEKM